VQNYTSLTNDQGAVRITIARWLTPNGRQIMVIGLEPDYVVEFTEEDFENDIDPQLDKAIELLIKKSQ
jgi:carboxyl-terminal processing protease